MSRDDRPDFTRYSLRQLQEARAGLNADRFPDRLAEIDRLIAQRDALDGPRAVGQYPARIRRLPAFDGRFDAYRLAAEGADVLFASYPAGTRIPPHHHDTDNYGVITRGVLELEIAGRRERHPVGSWYHVPAGVTHAATFAVETDEIEFWFREP